jgi:hypothetical protein
MIADGVVITDILIAGTTCALFSLSDLFTEDLLQVTDGVDLQIEEADPGIVVDLPDLLMVDMTTEEIVDKRIANPDSSYSARRST